MTQIADPQSFDRFALDYDRFVSLLPGQNTAWLLGLDLKGKRALDAGCGAGHAVEALADNFEEVVGLDLSAPLIEIARAKRARPNVRYAVEDLFGLKAEDDFDLVYSHTMLHHLEDYRAGLEHLKSLVRPGGTITLMLHGLRNQVGDSTFRRIEQSFFDRYRNKATSTQDYIDVADKVSGRDLAPYVKSWLYDAKTPPMPGHPD
ncbi:methyltransferase domain-containing protein, partial [Streptomyces sp. NPDC045456]|uniref:class I SAM-dependent methyltransferase n=1 Tax=Streptomyces sp. NPDC045456 TaxID=3155254 RepID=UPI0033F58DA9